MIILNFLSCSFRSFTQNRRKNRSSLMHFLYPSLPLRRHTIPRQKVRHQRQPVFSPPSSQPAARSRPRLRPPSQRQNTRRSSAVRSNNHTSTFILKTQNAHGCGHPSAQDRHGRSGLRQIPQQPAPKTLYIRSSAASTYIPPAPEEAGSMKRLAR